MNHSTEDTIQLTVLDDSGFLSKYWSTKPRISDEVASFLNHAVKGISNMKERNISISISSNSISHEEQKLYVEAIHNYYGNLLKDTVLERRRNLLSSMGLLLMGTLVLAFMVWRNLQGQKPVLGEVVDIVGWVFIWEAVDQLWFERHKINRDYFLYLKLASAPVIFTPLDAEGRKVYREEVEVDNSCTRA